MHRQAETADTVSAAARWPVMVLAYNEERHIEACLDSVFAAEPDRALEVYVMANGCSDRTEGIVKEYARRRPEVRLISIELGDKCNAWNRFIHDIVAAMCPGRDVYFFMDGDSRAVHGSFSVMAQALQANPYANAASAVPSSGRTMQHYRSEILGARGQVGNLYSLRGSLVERMRAQSMRLPLNLEGDDGLIGALVKWDLEPARNDFDHARIVACADAAFEFDSLSPLRPRDWKIYWNRLLRYGRRRYEFELLGPILKAGGVSAMPVDIAELYSQAGSLRVNWDGMYTLTNWIALRQIRRIGLALRARNSMA